MKLLRRRKTILVILVTIWLGGMVYFLAPLTGTKDDSDQPDDFDNLGDTSELESLEREMHEQDRNINRGNSDDSVSW